MKQFTTTLILILLVLVGCTNELDRCIEANTGNLENNLTEKWQKLMEEHLDENNDLPDGYSDIENDFLENVLTHFERAVEDCVGAPSPSYLYVAGLEEELSSESYKETVESCEKSIRSDKIEKATKICHAQGIY